MGIGIYFEEQNIDSLKEDSETYIGIYSIMAQSESENISANVSWGIRKRMQNGTYACRFNKLGQMLSTEFQAMMLLVKSGTGNTGVK